MRTEENGTHLVELKIETLKSLKAIFTRLTFLLGFLWLVAQATSAQSSTGTKPIYPIEFKPGTNTTVVKGTIARPMTPERQSDASQRFTLRARAGTFLELEISSDNHLAVFTLIKPSPAASRIDFVDNAVGVRRWSGMLKISGDYIVTVFEPDREDFFAFQT